MIQLLATARLSALRARFKRARHILYQLVWLLQKLVFVVPLLAVEVGLHFRPAMFHGLDLVAPLAKQPHLIRDFVLVLVRAAKISARMFRSLSVSNVV